jgi:hypothetical protein
VSGFMIVLAMISTGLLFGSCFIFARKGPCLNTLSSFQVWLINW